MRSSLLLSRCLSGPLLALMSLGSLQAEGLTQEQVKQLQEQLAKLEQEAKSDAQGRYREAYRAFRGAMQRESSTVSLYLDCLQKVDFEERGRSGGEFREWERRNRDGFKEVAWRRAVQHQLNWLVLTLEVERSEQDPESFAKRALENFSAILKDMPRLAGYEGIMTKPVTQTVFARAYQVDRFTKDGWPKHPLDVEALFDKVALPAAREASTDQPMRELWQTRIEFEKRKAQYWGHGKEPEREDLERQWTRFEAETLPLLHWRMELDCFKAGHQIQAIPHMLKIIEEHRGHKSREAWIAELKALAQPLLTDQQSTVDSEVSL